MTRSWTWSAALNEFISPEGMLLGDISRALQAEILAGRNLLDRRITQIVATDLMSRVLAYAVPGTLLLTNLANVQVVNTAGVAALSGVVIMNGARPSDMAVDRADALDLVVLITTMSAPDACRLVCGMEPPTS